MDKLKMFGFIVAGILLFPVYVIASIILGRDAIEWLKDRR